MCRPKYAVEWNKELPKRETRRVLCRRNEDERDKAVFGVPPPVALPIQCHTRFLSSRPTYSRPFSFPVSVCCDFPFSICGGRPCVLWNPHPSPPTTTSCAFVLVKAFVSTACPGRESIPSSFIEVFRDAPRPQSVTLFKYTLRELYKCNISTPHVSRGSHSWHRPFLQ